MSEADSAVERCPICNRTKCKRHLLACFDRSGDEGDFGIGLVDGVVLDVNEIEAVMKQARLVWVQSVRGIGEPLAPRWMKKIPGLDSYFAVLGSGDFDVAEYENDEDAAHDLGANTEIHDTQEFLWTLLSACGWLGDHTERESDAPMMSTMYVSWWSHRPSAIIKTLRRTLKAALLEAGLKVRSTSRAQRENQKIERMQEAMARYVKKEAEVVEPPTTAAKYSAAKGAATPLEEPMSPGNVIEPVTSKVGPMPPVPPLPPTPSRYTRPAAKHSSAKRAATPHEEPVSPGNVIEPVTYKVGPMPLMPPLPPTPYPYTRPYVFTDGTVDFADGFIWAMRLDIFERAGLARKVPFGIEFETSEQKLWLLGRKAFAPRFTHDVNKIAGAKADVDDILNADARSANRQPWKE